MNWISPAAPCVAAVKLLDKIVSPLDMAPNQMSNTENQNNKQLPWNNRYQKISKIRRPRFVPRSSNIRLTWKFMDESRKECIVSPTDVKIFNDSNFHMDNECDWTWCHTHGVNEKVNLTEGIFKQLFSKSNKFWCVN